jgi:hypothetical protein
MIEMTALLWQFTYSGEDRWPEQIGRIKALQIAQDEVVIYSCRTWLRILHDRRSLAPKAKTLSKPVSASPAAFAAMPQKR